MGLLHRRERWEQWGFAFVLIMALFSCISTAAMSIGIVLSALCVLGQRWFSGDWLNMDRKAVYAACVYIALYFVVALLSLDPKVSFQEFLGESYRFFPFFFAAAYVRTEKQFGIALMALAASVCLDNIVALWQFFSAFLQKGTWVRVKGTISTTNSFGNLLAMVMPLFAFGFWYPRASVRAKQFFAAAFVLSFVMIVVSQTRSAWAACLGAMLLAVLLDAQLRRYCVRLFGICACLFLLLAFFHAPFLTRMASIADTSSNLSNLERFYMWHGAMEIWKDYPIHGVGQDMYGAVYAGKDSKYRLPEARPYGNPHSIFFQVLSEGGVIGLFASVGFHLYFLFGLWRMHRKQKRRMVMTYGMAGILMATAIGIGGMFDAGMDHVGVARMYWLIMGILFAGASMEAGQDTSGRDGLC